MIGALLVAGCLKPVVPTFTEAKLPPGAWSTVPQFCAYEEIGQIHSEGWSYEAAVGPLLSRVGPGEAVVGYHYSAEVVQVPYKQCQDEGVDCRTATNGNYVTLWTAEGLRIRWVGDCPPAPR